MQTKRLINILNDLDARIDFIHSNEILFYLNGKYRIYYDYSNKCYSLNKDYRGKILLEHLSFKEFKKELEKIFC